METRTLGGTGIAVTRIILGCGNFGGIGSSPAFFGQGTPKDEAFRLMDTAWDLGITTFDTADAYGGGRSESFIGEWLATKGADVRDRIVIATKTFNPMDEGQDHGLGRGRIRRQLETSLRRLGVDRVALYLAHDFDPDTPQEETLQAFDELVRAGKIGARRRLATSPASNSPRRSSSRPSRGSRATNGCRTASPSSSREIANPSSRSATSTGSGTRRSARSRAAG